jgi:uncharacterized protein
MTQIRTISPTTARRLAVTRQRLAEPRPAADADGIMDVVRDIGCLQLDPISVVARSHLLVLWSRLGQYDQAHLDNLLWEERRLFEYWAHCASIVLTEDYPVYLPMMRAYGVEESGRGVRRRAWIEQNRALHDHILSSLAADGPLPSRVFEDRAQAEWHSTGWTSGRNTAQVLDYLWTCGTITVAGRAGLQKLWDLSERVLPEWTPREELSAQELTRRAAQTSLRALGVARAPHIQNHYIRGRYPGLTSVLGDLEAEGQIVRVQIAEDGRAWPGPWYVHNEDLALLDALEAGQWQPRTTLLSPFDNLICDRRRTELLFGFDFRIEIYVPKEKRRYGYYVLPILHGDRLIGRIDPAFNRARKQLTINAVHVEPGAPGDKDTGQAINATIEDLARFLGAGDIVYAAETPKLWRRWLRPHTLPRLGKPARTRSSTADGKRAAAVSVPA